MSPSAYNLPHEEVKIAAPDGVKPHAYVMLQCGDAKVRWCCAAGGRALRRGVGAGRRDAPDGVPLPRERRELQRAAPVRAAVLPQYALQRRHAELPRVCADRVLSQGLTRCRYGHSEGVPSEKGAVFLDLFGVAKWDCRYPIGRSGELARCETHAHVRRLFLTIFCDTLRFRKPSW